MLIEKYNCYPIFIDKDIIDAIMNEFFIPFIEPILTNTFDMRIVDLNNYIKLWEHF
jgi:hypothetical protein